MIPQGLKLRLSAATLLCLSALAFSACAGGANLDQIARGQNSAGSSGGAERPGGSGDVSELTSGQNVQLANGPVMTIVSGRLRLTENCLIGEGRLRLPDRDSVNDSWNISFNYSWESWARLRMIFQADADGTHGFSLDLARSPSGVQIAVEAQGAVENWNDLASLQTLLHRDQVAFNLDFHHDEAHRQFAHLLFYDNSKLVMDSGRDTVGTPGKGRGRAQFLDIEGVRLCGVALGAPKDGG